MFIAEKYSVVLWKNVHLLKDFLWLHRPPPPAPCCRGRRSAAYFSSSQRHKSCVCFIRPRHSSYPNQASWWFCWPGSEPAVAFIVRCQPCASPVASPWSPCSLGSVLPQEIPQQEIMVCWKSLETIKYHLGSFIAPLAAFGEQRFA